MLYGQVGLKFWRWGLETILFKMLLNQQWKTKDEKIDVTLPLKIFYKYTFQIMTVFK